MTTYLGFWALVTAATMIGLWVIALNDDDNGPKPT